MEFENETEVTQETEEQQEQTQEETVESLQAKLQASEKAYSDTQDKLTKRDQDVVGLNKSLQQRAAEAKAQTDIDTRIDGLQDTVELLATAIASGKASIDDVDDATRPDIVAELKKQRTQQASERKAKQDQEKQEEYNHMANGIFNRAKMVFGNDPDAVEKVEDLLFNGRIDRAEERVARAESKGTKLEENSEGKRETEDEKIDRKAKELLADRGLYTEFNTLPSAVTSDARKAMEEYGQGKITVEQAQKRGASFD